MKKLFSLSIAILLIPFFPPPLFTANILVDHDDQKERDYSIQPNNQVQQPLVCDYTILNNNNVNHTLEDEDIENIEDDLADNILAVNRKLVTSNKKTIPLILGTLLQHQQTNKYHQYLITSTGLLSETTQPNAVKRAHRKSFHLIQATPEHVILQLLEWLQISGHYTVTALHTNRPVCRHCCLIASSLWKKKLRTNEKGCFSPFPMLDNVPNLAWKYINTHLHLSLVQNLIVPMMGYVSKEEMKKAIQQKDEQIRMLSSEFKTKDNELNNKSQLIEVLSNQLEDKDEQIQMFNKEINKKHHQLNEKNQEVNNYKIHLLKNIAAQLKRLRTEFKLHLDDIHIKNENSVKNFVITASLQIKEGTKQLNEDMQTFLSWHAKYKGNNWKYFDEQDSNGTYWSDIYASVREKMDEISLNNEKILIFFSILKSLDTLFPTNKSRLCAVTKFSNQNSSQNERYRLEMAQMRGKLQRIEQSIQNCISWRWLK